MYTEVITDEKKAALRLIKEKNRVEQYLSVTAKDGTISVDVDMKITKGNGQSSTIDSMPSNFSRTNPS